MGKNRFLTRLLSGALVAAVAAGSALLLGGVANAAPPAGTLGTLTITPATGTDVTALNARTSAPCPTSADSSVVFVTGPVGAANPTFPPDNPFPIVTTTKASFSTTDPFDLPFGLTLKDAATDRGTSLQAGEYDVTAKCVKGLTQASFGTFTAAIFFTSPTTYNTGSVAVATTTSLAVSPSSPAASGTVETLTATVAPAGAVGSVQFKDNGANIGSAVSVSGGTASLTQTLASGSHPLTAVFTPTDATAFSASTSNTVTYVVTPPASATTSTALAVSPASPVVQGTPVTVKATITATPATAAVAGTVQFKDGSAALGSPVAVTGGSASLTTSALSVGSHSLTAVFTSTAANVSGSTSNTVTYVVNAPTGAKATRTRLSVFPTPAFQGIPVVFLANVAPANATGTVQFKDGTTTLGAPVPVFSGFALLITTLPKGTHSLAAVFIPTNPAAFASSTSTPVSLTVRSLF